MPEIERSRPVPAVAPRSPITPGLLVLHGNRLELLQEAVFAWLERHPLDPLEQDVLLVQSNGIAEWMKMSLARRSGICAATRVELPARFLWRLYRAMLGRDGAPARSPLDKAPLTWRLMQALPGWIGEPGFEPLAQFLSVSPAADGAHDLGRRLQLAERLADLFDQYQLYRADWLDAWGRGHEVLVRANGVTEPLPDDQRWQARLWHRLVEGLDASGRRAVRSDVHRRFVEAVDAGDVPRQPLPRRVVLFGHSHLPWQTLQALAALAQRSQVLLAVPNPCQFHWADIIDGRELLRAPRQRHGHRRGLDLGTLPLDQAHGQAHPLLAAWGRQGRDFIRLLDAFDDAETARQRFQIPRIDLFDDGDGDTLLAQVQSTIRDGLPMDELTERVQAGPPLADDDRSIVFQIAHSAMREVEVLHDQLLHLLAHPGDTPLAPRDIVVMVPDIEPYAPIIHAVFGQHGLHDARHIPYEIADLRQRGRQPLLMAVEWLLRVTEQRCTASELRDLLDVPALARRFGLHDEDRATAARWLAGAGVRWGLDMAQRDGLGLGACGEQNTGLFGLRRMLLGYACGRSDTTGAEPPWHAIEPYDEIGGLDAAIAGSLAGLIDALRVWWQQASASVSPAQWFARGQTLLQTFLDPADEDDRLMLASLDEALGRWLDDCEDAGFDAPVTLPVLREGWLAGVDEPSLNSRFLGGGVVFCTLMPMRAIPFEVVCLLGMNDGDYPRRAPRSDFDLMALPGQHRPGDRARRDDDRMLMLEALLAARRVLSISWAGRSVRDNTAQPPSVLVSQLRDHLAAGWGPVVVARRTVEHPLQPFSRRYFETTEAGEGGAALRTYAREWREAHAAATPADRPASAEAPVPGSTTLSGSERAAMLPLTLRRLENFLLNPVKDHFRERLGVVFQPLDLAVADDEPFDLNALDETVLLRELLESPAADAPVALAACRAELHARTERLVRRGDLPVGGLGQRWRGQFVQQSAPMALQWNAWRRALSEPAKPRQVTAELGGIGLDDWLDELRQAPGTDHPVWLTLDARRLCVYDRQTQALRPLAHKLVRPWLRMLVAGACGIALEARIVARDALLVLAPPRTAVAQVVLDDLLDVWEQGMLRPLAVACRTALAWLAVRAKFPDQPDKADDAARAVYEGGHNSRGEVQDAVLARLFPDWDTLVADPAFAQWAERLYEPLRAWAADPGGVTVLPLPDAHPGADEDDEDARDD
ncbi:exodeoxyribonuclease V subunit gamma [Sphaerotilus sp.]|uniref:exodeoxyribonuclease V subunit gamma n=1 Tax=Sphaerotilus sp. TaxID=2093942 RepID=UPI0034E287AC